MPEAIKEISSVVYNPITYSGLIVKNPWPYNATFNLSYSKYKLPINELDGKHCYNEMMKLNYRANFRIKCCMDHWLNNIPWEDTGIYEWLLMEIKHSSSHRIDGCSNIADIKKRYKKLDQIFSQVQEEGRFRLEEEICTEHFLDSYFHDYVHIGPDGIPYSVSPGWHRYAISLILKIPYPLRIGYVHEDALSHYSLYR